MSNTITLDLARIAAIREAKGWDAPSPDNIDRKLLLAISEITEIQGELRHGHALPDIYYAADIGFWCIQHHRIHCTECYKQDSWERFEHSKPEGCGVEIADAIMRLADIAFANGIDLQRCLEEKMIYNAQRPYQHGGRNF